MNNILQHQQGSVILASLAKHSQTNRLEPDSKQIVKFAGQFVLQKFIQSWKATGARTLEQGNKAVFQTPKYGTLYEVWVEFKITVECEWNINSHYSYVIIPPLLALELVKEMEWQKRSGTRLTRIYPEQIIQKIMRMPHHKRRRYLRALGGLSVQNLYGRSDGGITKKTVTVRLPLMFDMFDDPRTQPDTLATDETQFMLEGRTYHEWLGRVDASTVENWTNDTVGQASIPGDPLTHESRGLGNLKSVNYTIEDLDFHYYYRIYREPFRTNLRRLMHRDTTGPARYMEFSYFLESLVSKQSKLSYIVPNDDKYEGIIPSPVLAQNTLANWTNMVQNNGNKLVFWEKNNTTLQPAHDVNPGMADVVNFINQVTDLYSAKTASITQRLLIEIELRCDQPITSSVIALRFGKNHPVLKSFYRYLFAAPSLHMKEEYRSRLDYTVKFMEASSVLWEATRDSLGWESEMTGVSFHESLEEVSNFVSNVGVLHDSDVNLQRSPPLGYIVIDWGQYFKYKGMRTAITLKNLSNPKFVIDIPVLVDNITVSRLVEPNVLGPLQNGQITAGSAQQAASVSVIMQSPLDARFRVEEYGTYDDQNGVNQPNYATVCVPPVTEYDFHMEVYHQVLKMMVITYDPDFRNSIIDAEVEN